MQGWRIVTIIIDEVGKDVMCQLIKHQKIHHDKRKITLWKIQHKVHKAVTTVTNLVKGEDPTLHNESQEPHIATRMPAKNPLAIRRGHNTSNTDDRHEITKINKRKRYTVKCTHNADTVQTYLEYKESSIGLLQRDHS